ncbi:hypothetical protein RND64_04510 [Gordonia sp. w5E2]|uniref:hypothetical protein n=1 Tax=Gordonia sp. w5E2 TaxID=3075837 RepID=UPI002F41D73B
MTNEPEFIRRLIDKPAREGEAALVYAPLDSGRDLLEPPGLREWLRVRLAARLVELSPEHATPVAWQAQLSTGILGALVPPCPDGVGVLSLGLDSAMRQRGLRRCTHRLRQATTLRATPLRHAVHPVLVDPSWKLLGYVSAER